MRKLAAIWLLFGGKAGDNAQVQALGAGVAAHTGWDYTVKQLKHHYGELLLHITSRPTLLGITAASRDSLRAPWPKLVISAGRRNELVAQWLKRQSPQTRLVHIGRPWCHPRRFDQIVATDQYLLNGYPNVLSNELPLHTLTPEILESAKERWRDTLNPVTNPRTVLLLGGNSGSYVLDARQAEQLAERLSALSPGGLIISSSRRTPEAFLDRLLALVPTPELLYRWGEAGDNPYPGLLAWADRLIVTEDSVSMTAEALMTGAPVFIAPIDSARPEDGSRWWLRRSNYNWKALSHRLGMSLAPERFHRDVRRFHWRLVDAGKAAWLGDAPTLRSSLTAARTSTERSATAAAGGDDLSRAVAAVCAVLDPGQ